MHLPQFSLIASQTWVSPWQMSTGGVWGAGVIRPTVEALIDALHFDATQPAPEVEYAGSLLRHETMSDNC